jgi:hypothetical protein
MSSPFNFDIQDGAALQQPVSGAPYVAGGVTFGAKVIGSSGVSASQSATMDTTATNAPRLSATQSSAKDGDALASMPPLAGEAGGSLASLIDKWAPWAIGAVVVISVLKIVFRSR